MPRATVVEAPFGGADSPAVADLFAARTIVGNPGHNLWSASSATHSAARGGRG